MFAIKYATANPVLRAYTYNEDKHFSIPGWKVYEGTKKSTAQKHTLYVHDKKGEDRLDILKREVSILARLRHPSITHVVETLTEGRYNLVYVTEIVVSTLQNIQPDELEIQKGLIQLITGLNFIHSIGTVHLNVSPSSIFINAKGDWKLAGFGYAKNENTTAEDPDQEYRQFDLQGFTNLDFAAPEYVIDNVTEREADIFSVGCIIYSLYNRGKSPIPSQRNINNYKAQVNGLNSLSYHSIPATLRDILPQLLTRRPTNRMSLNSLQASAYFDNILINALKFLDNFPEKSSTEKASFMKGLLKILPQFPTSVLQKKILPALIEELKDLHLITLIIPNIMTICSGMSQLTFSERALPGLKTIFTLKEPPGAIIALLDRVDVLREKTTDKQFAEEIMPLMYNALESPAHFVQEKALKVLKPVMANLDFVTVKTVLLPHVSTTFSKTTMLGIKVACLELFLTFVKVLDKYTVADKLLPLLKNIKTREPSVMMATLLVFEEIGKIADQDTIASDILPQLWVMSLGPLLKLDQFKKFMSIIKALSNKVEEAQLRKLRDSGNGDGQGSTSVATNGFTETGDVDVDFESLVLGKANNTPNMIGDLSADSSMANSRATSPPISVSNPFGSLQPPMQSQNASRPSSSLGGASIEIPRFKADDDFGGFMSNSGSNYKTPSTANPNFGTATTSFPPLTASNSHNVNNSIHYSQQHISIPALQKSSSRPMTPLIPSKATNTNSSRSKSNNYDGFDSLI